MSSFVEWIHAEAGDWIPQPKPPAPDRPPNRAPANQRSTESNHPRNEWTRLPARNFRAGVAGSRSRTASARGNAADRDPDIWLYRNKTVSLLRRYMRWSLEAGRVPSLLGRELFRARITSYTATTFEARVIFLHDVERCLERLDDFARQVIARAILQEHSHEAAARLLHCTRKTVERRLPEILDDLSDAFLKAELLTPFPRTDSEIQ